ncbi:MAG: putative transposase OrfB [Parachlamydiales bacterium]|nr:putative transposase OrfB [Parachlamydiales bacterium]
MHRRPAHRTVSSGSAQALEHPTFQLLLQECARQTFRTAAYASHRGNLYGAAVFGFAQDCPGSEEGGLRHQSQACSTDYAALGNSWQSAGTQYLKAASGASQIPLPAGQRGIGGTTGCLEHGHHVYPAAKRVCVPCDCNRLVQPLCAVIPSLQQHRDKFCLDALEEAIERHGKPKIFNTDQGVQFTSREFVQAIVGRDILFSMDGRGRALDNVFVERLWRSMKYEDVYLQDYQSVPEARAGLASYFQYYNTKRLHQALGYKTPHEVDYAE